MPEYATPADPPTDAELGALAADAEQAHAALTAAVATRRTADKLDDDLDAAKQRGVDAMVTQMRRDLGLGRK